MAPLTAHAALHLTLDQTFPESGVVRFRAYDPVEFPQAPARTGREQTVSTEHYSVWVDLDEVTRDKYGSLFRYVLYATVRGSAGPITQFTFQGEPSGLFEDQIADVDFSIGDGVLSERGRIQLPVFSPSPSSPLQGPVWHDPVEVHLATEKTIPITLRNELKRMAIEVKSIHLPNAGVPPLWKPITIGMEGNDTFNPFHLAPGTAADHDLLIRLQPQIANALGTASVPRGRNVHDDDISILVDYEMVGRGLRTAKITVPVHFQPWPPFLLLVTLAGVFLGSLLPLADRNLSWGDRGRALLAAALVGLAAELLAMLFVIGGTEVRLFNVQVDPFQIPTAALIGLVIGMSGSRSIDAFHKFVASDFWKQRAGVH